jgi:T-complex protein 1 subunit delta
MAVRTANIVAARAVADAVRTSLGPRGSKKISPSSRMMVAPETALPSHYPKSFLE